MSKIEGILPALITPYGKDGQINEETLRGLVDWNLEKNVDGFYVGGSTAEAFLLTEVERMRLAEVVSDQLNGRAALIVHVGSIRTDMAVQLARHAAEHGADAVSAISPFYYQFTTEEIKQYYLDIADAVEIPLILYNFPAFSGVTLDEETAGDLFADERIVGIKHTSLDLYQLERMKRLNPTIRVFNGHDEVFLGALAMGADGAIGSTYNFMAEKFVAIRELYLADDHAGAATLQAEANDIISVLKRVGVFNAVKYLLELQGFECGQCRRPFAPLTKDDRRLLEQTRERDRART